MRKVGIQTDIWGCSVDNASIKDNFIRIDSPTINLWCWACYRCKWRTREVVNVRSNVFITQTTTQQPLVTHIPLQLGKQSNVFQRVGWRLSRIPNQSGVAVIVKCLWIKGIERSFIFLLRIIGSPQEAKGFNNWGINLQPSPELIAIQGGLKESGSLWKCTRWEGTAHIHQALGQFRTPVVCLSIELRAKQVFMAIGQIEIVNRLLWNLIIVNVSNPEGTRPLQTRNFHNNGIKNKLTLNVVVEEGVAQLEALLI